MMAKSGRSAGIRLVAWRTDADSPETLNPSASSNPRRPCLTSSSPLTMYTLREEDAHPGLASAAIFVSVHPPPETLMAFAGFLLPIWPYPENGKQIPNPLYVGVC